MSPDLYSVPTCLHLSFPVFLPAEKSTMFCRKVTESFRWFYYLKIMKLYFWQQLKICSIFKILCRIAINSFYLLLSASSWTPNSRPVSFTNTLWVFFFSGSLFQPSGKVRRYWKRTTTKTHAADGRKHESSQPLRVQPVWSLPSLRAG